MEQIEEAQEEYDAFFPDSDEELATLVARETELVKRLKILNKEEEKWLEEKGVGKIRALRDRLMEERTAVFDDLGIGEGKKEGLFNLNNYPELVEVIREILDYPGLVLSKDTKKALTKAMDGDGQLSSEYLFKLQSEAKPKKGEKPSPTGGLHKLFHDIKEEGKKRENYDEVISLRKELEEISPRLSMLRMRLARERSEELGLTDFSITSITEAMSERSRIKDNINSRRAGFLAWLDKQDFKSMPKKDLLKWMPEGKMKDDIQNDPSGDITKEKALEIMEKATDAALRRANRITHGWFTNISPARMRNNPSILTGLNINTTREVPAADRSNKDAMDKTLEDKKKEKDSVLTPEYLKKNYKNKTLLTDLAIELGLTTEENRKSFQRQTRDEITKLIYDESVRRTVEGVEDRESTLDALVELHGILVGLLKGAWGKEAEGVVPISLVDTALAAAGEGSLYDVNVVLLMREAIRDIDGNEIDSNTTGEELLPIYDTLMVDLNLLVPAIARLIAKSDKELATIVDASLSQLITKLRDPSHRDSKFGLLTAVRLTERLGRATQHINKARYEALGFAKELDNDTRLVDETTTSKNILGRDVDEAQQEAWFIGHVKVAFRRRLKIAIERTYGKNNKNKSKVFRHLAETYRVKPEDDWDIIADKVFEQLQKEKNGVSREDIIKMGNGEFSYQPAKTLGYQLMDYILTRDGLKTLDPKRKLDYIHQDVTTPEGDLKEFTGESERELPLLEGELNTIAPEKLSTIATILEDDLLRARIRWVNKLPLFDEKTGDLNAALIAEYDEMVASDMMLSNEPRGINIKLQPGVRLRPHIQNAQLGGKVLTEDETVDVITEMLLHHAEAGYYYIHDNRFTGGKWRPFYKEGAIPEGVVHEDLTLGDATVVPFSSITSIMALEQMSPHLKGLTSAVLKRSMDSERKFFEANRERLGLPADSEYWKEDVFWDNILDPSNQHDRKFNGYYVTKILGLTSDKAKKAIADLEDKILYTHVPDMYIRTGLRIWEALKETNKTHKFGPLEEGFQLFDKYEIKTEEDYENFMDSEPDDSLSEEQKEVFESDKLKVSTLRDFLKDPVMTKLYTAGWNSFIKFWKTDGKGMQKIWPKLEKAGFVDASHKENQKDGVPEWLNVIGRMFHEETFNNTKGALSMALQLDEFKQEALDLLTMDESREDGARESWEETVKGFTGEELSQDNPMRRMDRMKRQWDYNIKRMAERRGQSLSEFRKQYDKKLDEVESIFDRAEREKRDLTTEEEREIKGILTPHNAWKENLFFYALNVMNSSRFKLNIEALQKQAEIFGYEFEPTWLMGFEQAIMYHVFLPGQNSTRAYSTESSLERHHHTVKWGKIMSNPQKFNEFLSSLTEEELADPKLAGDKAWEWAKQQEEEGNESPLGIWEAGDNSEFISDPDSMSEADLQEAERRMTNRVRAMLIKDNLIGLAMFDAIPMKSYTQEENTLALEKTQAGRWDQSSEVSGKRRATRKGKGSPLKDKDRAEQAAVIGGQVDPSMGTQVTEPGNIEYTERELAAIGSNGPLYRNTSNPKGLLAWQPRMERTPMSNLGNLHLQHRLYLQQQAEVFGTPLMLQQEMRAEADQSNIISSEFRGHTKPWNKESLPTVYGVDAELFDSLAGLHVNPSKREAARMEQQLRQWASRQGLSHLLDPKHEDFDHNLIPYLYLSMKADNILNDQFDDILQNIRWGRDKVGGFEHTVRENIVHAANTWKLELHKLMELPRNIRFKQRDGLTLETKGHEVGIMHPDFKDLTIQELLTSVYDPVNNPLGHLLNPTLLHKALSIDMVLGEGMLVVEGINRDEKLLDKETAIWPLIVQNHDFQSYLVEILWDKHLWNAIREFNKLNPDDSYAGTVTNKEDWNKISNEHKEEIFELAEAIGLDKENPLVEFHFIEENTNDENVKRLIVDVPVDATEEQRRQWRNSFGGSFSFLVRTSRIIQGANIQLALTPNGAMNMLVNNSNAAIFRRMELAYHTQFALGVRQTEDGQWIPAEAESQVLEQHFGRDMRAQLDQAVVESDAMKYMVNKIMDKPEADVLGEERAEYYDDNVETLVDGTRKLGSVAPRVVDWIEYRSPEDRLPFHVSALIAPLRTVHHSLIITGIGDVGHLNEDFNVVPIIEELLKNTTKDLGKFNTQEAVIVSLLLRDPDLTAEEALGFLDVIKTTDTEAEYNKKARDVYQAYQSAKEKYRKIQRLAQLPDSEYFNKYYWEARSFIEKVIEGKIKIDPDDPGKMGAQFVEFLLEKDVIHSGETSTQRGVVTDLKKKLEATKVMVEKKLKKPKPDKNGEFYTYSDIVKIKEELEDAERRLGDTKKRFDEAYQRASEEAQIALAAATKGQAMQEPPVISSMPHKKNDISDHKKFSDKYPELAQLSDKINKTFGENSLRARMMRAVVLRVYEYNPSIIRNLLFDFKGLDSFAEKLESGQYRLWVGTKHQNAPASRLAYALAHEFAHVGATKYLENGGKELQQWRRLFLKEKREGNGLVRKVVLAAHDNVWSSAAQKEYDYYMNHTDSNGNPSANEFIAALTGYYILNDSLPKLKDLTLKEAGHMHKMDNIIKRIMTYIHGMMSKLGTVFSDFKQTAPKEWDAVESLIHRTMGFKVDEDLINNKATGPMFLEGVESSDTTTEDGVIRENLRVLRESSPRLEKIEQAVIREKSFREKGTPKLSDIKYNETMKEYEELLQVKEDADNKILEAGGNTKDPWGLTRSEYLENIDEISALYFDEDTGMIDLDALVLEGLDKHIRTMASYITRALRDMYIGRDGEFLVLADSALDGLPFFNDKRNKVKKLLASGTVGSTGANYTWNSPFQMLVWLSTLVDSSLSTLPGHWGNLEGLPSVVSELHKVAQMSEEIGTLMEVDINKELTTVVGRVLDVPGITGKVSDERIRKRDAISKDILMVIEGKQDDFSSPEVLGNEKILAAAKKIVGTYTTMVQSLINQNKEHSGVLAGNLQSLIPWRFATGKLKHTDNESIGRFNQALRKRIVNHIQHNTAKIDPFAAYVAGYLPNLLNANKGIGDLKRLRNSSSTKGIYTELLIMSEAIYLRNKRGRGTTLKDALGEIRKTPEDIDRAVTRAEARLGSEEGEAYYTNTMMGPRGAISSIMRKMGSTSDKIGTMVDFNITSDVSVFRSGLNSSLRNNENLSGEQRARLDDLKNAKNELPDVLMPSTENKHTNIPINNVADLHIRNILDGAGMNVYFPQSWAIPSVSSVLDDPDISEYLVVNPKELSDGIMRSMGQNTMIQSMFKDRFNLKVSGTTLGTGPKTAAHAVLSIFDRAVNQHGEMLNDDGSIISSQERDNIRLGIRTISEKLDLVLGRKNVNQDSADETANFLTKYAPDIVRVIYGSNLVWATLIVENSMNIWDNLFGRGSIGGFVSSIMAPFSRMTSEVSQQVARDQHAMLRIFSQGHIPDFAKMDSGDRNNFIQRLPKWLGERNMYLAGTMHEMIATGRAVIFRNWMKSNLRNGKLRKIAPAIRSLRPDDLKGMQKVMKKAGLPIPDAALMSYLVTEGLFSDDGNLDILEELIKTEGDELYSLGDMISTTSLNADLENNTAEFEKRRDIIAALSLAEKAFIKEILVSPNPFDTYTGNGSWNHMIEIFRRYPVLFVSQQLIRKIPRFSAQRMAFNMLAYSLFDILYMTSLLLATGHDVEDIKEDWAKNPTRKSVESVARLPHLGRYLSMFAELALVIKGWGYGKGAAESIPLSAVASYGGNISSMIEAGFDKEKEVQPHQIINSMRIVLGAISRMMIYQIGGEDYTRPKKGQKAGYHVKTFGDTSDGASYTTRARSLLQSVGWIKKNNPNLWHTFPPSMKKTFKELLEARDSLVQPEERSEVPSPTPEARIPETASQDVVGDIAEVGGLEIPKALGVENLQGDK